MSCRLWLFMCSRLSISRSGAYHCVTIHHIGHYNHKTFHFQNWQLFSSPFCTTEADCLSQSFIYFVIHHSVLKLFFSCVSRSFWILLVFQYMCSPEYDKMILLLLIPKQLIKFELQSWSIYKKTPQNIYVLLINPKYTPGHRRKHNFPLDNI